VNNNDAVKAPSEPLFNIPNLDAALALGVSAITILLALTSIQPDAAFISYRYARHITDGTGFVYNPGNGANIAVAPLYVLLLSGASRLIPRLPALGAAFNAVFVGAGGLLLLLTASDDRSTIERVFSAFVYVTFPLWWLEVGAEMALVGFLGLSAVLAQARGKSLAAALLAGLALLVRPVAILLGIILVADLALDQRRVPLQEAVTLLMFMWLSGMLTVWSFGWPFPTHVLLGSTPAGTPLVTHALTSRSLAGLGKIGGALLAQSWIWGGLLLLAGVGLTRVLKRWWPLLLLVWTFLHGVALDILRVPSTRGDYAALVPALAALIGMGVAFASEKLADRVGRYTLLGGAALLLVGAVVPSLRAIRQAPTRDDAYYQAHGPAMLPDTSRDAYRQAGEWLAENAPDDAVVAADHVGKLGYYAERDMLDASGLLLLDAQGASLSGDAFWYLPDVAPDYVIFSPSSLREQSGYRPLEDPWFGQSYAEVNRFGDTSTLGGPLVIYQRQVETPTLAELDIEEEVRARYAHGLLLEGFETNLQMDPLPTGATDYRPAGKP
jgi:hypothetical protein